MTESARPDDDEADAAKSDAIRAGFDWSAVAPSTAVIEAVAIAADREPVALEPLYDSIDPEALDAFVLSTETQPTAATSTVAFGLDGHDVTVHCDGTVVVLPVEPRTEPEYRAYR